MKRALEQAIDSICTEREISRAKLFKKLPWLAAGLEGKPRG